jgi:transposase
MQTSNVSTPITERNSTIFVALELSQRSWLVTLHSPDKDRMSRHKVGGGDHAGLLALIERVRERAARALGAVPAVVSCYEAGYDGFWLHRRLLAAGIPNHVFDLPGLRSISGPGGRRPTGSMASRCCGP